MQAVIDRLSAFDRQAKHVQNTDLDAEVDRLPLGTRFTLGKEITPIQKAFFDRHGFILFANVASQKELDAIYASAISLPHLDPLDLIYPVVWYPCFA